MYHWHLKQAARKIHAGGIVAYPTEAVYGLGCDPMSAAAVLRLLELKKREIDKGLILIASDFKQLQPYLAKLPTKMEKKIMSTWPGPVTWILPANQATPVWLTGAHDSIAVRVTAHPIASALCQQAGMALVSTSANISNQHPARNALDIHRIFDDQLDYILHSDTATQKNPTEIRDGKTGKILRSS
jgi:L-threonylcarbamoyladenylate synthase